MKAVAVEAGDQAVIYVPERLVTVAMYSLLSGRTEKSIRRKIEDGRWVQGREYHRDPDGGIMIDRTRVEQWVTG